jgi:hypothetical protein
MVLLSPAIDVPRTPVLRVMTTIQGLILPMLPFWRIVPAPSLEAVTPLPEVVRPSDRKLCTMLSAGQ